jgi:hypothetical protein
MGVKTLYGHRQVWNIASEKSAKKFTANILVRAEYIRVLTSQRLRYSKFSSNFLNKGKNIEPEHDTSKIFYYCYPISSSKAKHPFTIKIENLKI